MEPSANDQVQSTYSDEGAPQAQDSLAFSMPYEGMVINDSPTLCIVIHLKSAASIFRMDFSSMIRSALDVVEKITATEVNDEARIFEATSTHASAWQCVVDNDADDVTVLTSKRPSFLRLPLLLPPTSINQKDEQNNGGSVLHSVYIGYDQEQENDGHSSLQDDDADEARVEEEGDDEARVEEEGDDKEPRTLCRIDVMFIVDGDCQKLPKIALTMRSMKAAMTRWNSAVFLQLWAPALSIVSTRFGSPAKELPYERFTTKPRISRNMRLIQPDIGAIVHAYATENPTTRLVLFADALRDVGMESAMSSIVIDS